MSYNEASHATPNGVTLDVPQSSADDLDMVARLLRRPIGEVFAEAVEHVRHTYLPASRPVVQREPKAPKTAGRGLKAAS